MKIIKYAIPFICALFLAFGTARAQNNDANVSVNLPKVALLDIEPAGTVSLNFTAPSEAGAPLINPTDNSKWLNYTSAIKSSDPLRHITAKVDATVPGIAIKLKVAQASGSGGGTLGTPVASPVTLSTTPITIVSGIGGAYTGDGTGNGHQLTVSLVPSNYGQITAQNNTTIIITYTLSN